jgi:antitoxin PrlF
MSEATVTSKGQLTIPADIRSALGLTTGERVVFTRLADGTTVMRVKRRSIMQLKGLLKPARGKKKVSIAAMDIGRE